MSEQEPRRSGLDHAFDTVRDVHRHRRHHRPPVFLGVILLGLGVLFLLDNLNVLESRDVIRTFWPVLLMGWGVFRLVSGRGGERIIGAMAVGFGGLFLGDRLFGWDINVMGVFWPLVLIALGINVLSRTWGRRPVVGGASVSEGRGGTTEGTSDDSVDTSATIKEFAVMAGVERENVSQTFRGGDVTAVMGSVEIDLRGCRMAGDEVQVSVFVMMGETVFRIPRDWTVDSRLTVVMAHLDDRSEAPVGEAPKRFVILGSAFMGNVQIRN